MTVKRIIFLSIEWTLWVMAVILCTVGFTLKFARPDLIVHGNICILIANCTLWLITITNLITIFIPSRKNENKE